MHPDSRISSGSRIRIRMRLRAAISKKIRKIKKTDRSKDRARHPSHPAETAAEITSPKIRHSSPVSSRTHRTACSRTTRITAA